MKMTNQEYNEYVKKKAPKSPVWADVVKAFIVGGLICCAGEGLGLLFKNVLDLDKDNTATAVSMTLVFLAALLTGLGAYDNMAKFAGAGTLVPITGFANSIVSPALEFKTEGYVLGTAVKMFTIAGPVIVFGLSASVIVGLIYCLL
jgi:stage V sporulation protein AC